MKERALTYEEFIALAKANYTKGGDGRSVLARGSG